jgi:hypothetical protein
MLAVAVPYVSCVATAPASVVPRETDATPFVDGPAATGAAA